MSDYGLFLKNEGGGVQIDSTYKNYSLHQTGSGVYTTSVIIITSTSSVPIFAFRPHTSGFCSPDSWVVSGSNYTGLRFFGAESTSVNWAVFTLQPINSLPPHGIVVWGPAGEVVFSSDEKYFKVIGVYPVTFLPKGYANVTVSDADANYFFFFPKTDIGYVLGGTHVYLAGLKKISSSIIRMQYALGAALAANDVNIDNTNYPTFNGFLIEVKL